MLDHVSIPVRDLEKSRQFYTTVLKTLGLSCTRNRNRAAGFGLEEFAPIFWLLKVEGKATAVSGAGLHISFQALDRKSVDKFHETGLMLGARDAGAPGLRPEYTAPFYGAFLIDPDGFKIEAVCRADE